MEGAHSQLFDVTGDLEYLPLGLKPMHRLSFLPTAIFILRGKKNCWVLNFFNINCVDMELSKFKCLCVYVFYISFFLISFSDPTGSE